VNLEDKRHVAIFLLGASFAFYLLGAAWSAIFIVALPQDPDWCQDVVEIQTGENSYEERCVAFKNQAAEIKHYHNQRMIERNKYWLYATLVLGGLAGILAFHTMPRWRGQQTSSSSLGGGIAAGVMAAFLGPLLLGWLLPAPIHWFPREFAEIHEVRQDAALRELGIAP
jgi:hypothetical protein